ncbi:hypothetical protein QTN47_26185 [Danxiaibacter flavus]|uniref:Zinc ribbon domain-containing protein n=1 Tax=Danxiaibacter flavus TaxID=3049108 RepID=A0ABV3ZN84_9BACT|nr:hypothetical protein QNM32_26185 [Chitinophagaceae bacterium DXS]
MKHLFRLLLVVVVVSTGCKSKESTSAKHIETVVVWSNQEDESTAHDEKLSDYADGIWCADVEYYNPNTGTRHTYELNVEVENGQLIRINWPNGGWLDESHFISEDIGDGECSFISDKGYHYQITLENEGECSYVNHYQFQHDVATDQQSLICPMCGNKKYSYEEICFDCERRAYRCPKCLGRKSPSESLCSFCESDLRLNHDEKNDFENDEENDF